MQATLESTRTELQDFEALAVVLVVLIGNNLRNRHHAAEAFRADVQLWEEVNVQISRPVPVSMEPLVNLIAWESDPGEK
jgi:hypothetical protein